MMWNLFLYSAALFVFLLFFLLSFFYTTFLLLRDFSLVAVVMEECHISL